MIEKDETEIVIKTGDDYIKYVSDSMYNVADWVVDEARRYVKLHKEYELAMSALRLFKEHYGVFQEFDEVWEEWKGVPIRFHFDVFPNADGTKMIVAFVDDKEKKDD